MGVTLAQRVQLQSVPGEVLGLNCSDTSTWPEGSTEAVLSRLTEVFDTIDEIEATVLLLTRLDVADRGWEEEQVLRHAQFETEMLIDEMYRRSRWRDEVDETGGWLILSDNRSFTIMTIEPEINAYYPFEKVWPSELYPNSHYTSANDLQWTGDGELLVMGRPPWVTESTNWSAPKSVFRVGRGLSSSVASTFSASPACGTTLEDADQIYWNIETNLPYGEVSWLVESEDGLDPSVNLLIDGASTNSTHVPGANQFQVHGFDRRLTTDAELGGANLVASSGWFDAVAEGCARAGLVIAESADGTAVEEQGGTDSFTVRLNSSILKPVTIALREYDPAELTVNPAELVFLPGQEFIEQVVTVTGVDDEDLGDEAQVVALLPDDESFDSYVGLAGADVVVFIIDDEQQAADAAALQAAVDQAATAEAAAQAALAQAEADQDAAAQAAAAQALAVAAAEQALAQAAADQDAAAQAAATQALAQAAAEQALADAAVVAQELADAAAAQAGIDQEAAVQAAVEQALAEVAAAEAAAAEVAAAEVAAAEVAAAEVAAAEAAAAEAAAGVVSTGYTAEDFASVASAAEFMELTISEFQATGVYVVDLLTQLGEGGYDSVSPLTDPPDVSGSESIAFTWDDEGQEVLDRVSTGYQVTPAEAQKFGAFLLTFFVGLTRG